MLSFESMSKSSVIIYFAVVIVSLAACNRGITPKMLVGKWNYVRVENPYSPNPPDTVPAREIIDKAPYIELSDNGKLLMIWGGKVLSYGNYRLDKENIIYTEQLPAHQSRTIVFWIKALDEKQLVFETREDDAVRVTAVKSPVILPLIRGKK